jgi:hypothetical protein
VRQENLGLLLALVGRRGEGFGVTGTGGLARPCIGTFSRLVAPSPKLITARSQNCALPHLESSFASCHAFSDGEKLTSSLRAHGTIHEARLLQGLISRVLSLPFCLVAPHNHYTINPDRFLLLFK